MKLERESDVRARMVAELRGLSVSEENARLAASAALGCRDCFEAWFHVRRLTGLGPYATVLFLKKHGVMGARRAA